MTIGEIIKLEEKAGRRLTQKEIRAEETKRLKQIKKYCNHYMYTDVEPYEVVRVISEQTVEVRPMKTTLTRAPKEFHRGGFLGHFSDNRAQEYEYESLPEADVIRIRWSKANRRWQKGGNKFLMSDNPYKFYDYNF